MNHAVSYDDIHEALLKSDLSGSASELHGVLSGMLCMDVSMDTGPWLSDFFGPELGQMGADCQEKLHRLFHQTHRQLVDFDFSFEPLLPDDEAPLQGRALALSDWCHGFLQGLGYSGPSSAWPGACSEILQDFLEIVRLDATVSGDTVEGALTELSDYVSVGVQVIRSELENPTSTQQH